MPSTNIIVHTYINRCHQDKVKKYVQGDQMVTQGVMFV